MGFHSTLREVAQPAMRPSIPPLLVIALPLWAATVLAYPLLRMATGELCVALACACLLGSFSLLGVVWKRHGNTRVLVLLGVAVGLFCTCAHAAVLHADVQRVSKLSYQNWEFVALDDASKGSFGNSVVARAYSETTGVLTVRANLPDAAGSLLKGDKFCAAGIVKPVDISLAPYMWERGIAGTVSLSHIERRESQGITSVLFSWRAVAVQNLAEAGDASGLMQALACGYRENLDEDLYDSFKTAGLAHLVAVSGAHLSLVVAFLAFVLRMLRVSRKALAGITVALVLVYLAFSGVPLSGIRAAFMACSGLLAFFVRRRGAALNALGLCIMGFVAFSAVDACSASCILSAGSTLGIIVFSRLISSWIEALWSRVPHVLRDGLALTLSANIATTAYSAALFSQLPLLAPLSNVAAGVFFPFACGASLLAALTSVVAPAYSDIAVMVANLPCTALEQTALLFGGVPYGCLPVSLEPVFAIVLSVVLCAALWRFWPRPSAKLFAVFGAAAAVALAVIFAFSIVRAHNEIVMLDVGQGDAFLVRSHGATALIDTGNKDTKLLSALARHGVWQLDALFISHADDDHCGSLDALRGVVQVRQVFLAADTFECECASCGSLLENARTLSPEVTPLLVGDVVHAGDVAFEVVSPETFSDEGGNVDSLVLAARFDVTHNGIPDYSALFCGDAEAEQLRALIKEGRLQSFGILKVGHHGAKVALTEDVLQTLAPRIALLSVGENNRYGHPSKEVLSLLASAEVTTFRSDLQGDVSCELTADAVNVHTLR